MKVKLSSICDINPKTHDIDETILISFVAMPDVSEDGEINTNVIRPFGEVKKGYTIFQEGDVLLAKITPCMENGKGALAVGLKNGIGVGSTEFHVLRPNTDLVDGMWLYYLTAWPVFRYEAEMHMTGSAGQKRVPKSFLESYQVSVSDLNIQRNQVKKLEKVNRIIEARRKQLQKLDELVKARFIEMFGDPVSNPKGWPMPRIEEVVSADKNALKAGPFGSALKKEYYVEFGYKIYGQEQVISGNPNYGDYYIDEERYHQLENCSVQAGDVLISLVGTYGKLLIMPQVFEPGIINPRLMKITFDKGKVNPYYFQHYFQSESLKKALADDTHGGTMDILNLGIVKNLRMPLPPIELQNSFVDFVSKVDKSKLSIQASLDQLETLKQSLMQEYFG